MYKIPTCQSLEHLAPSWRVDRKCWISLHLLPQGRAAAKGVNYPEAFLLKQAREQGLLQTGLQGLSPLCLAAEWRWLGSTCQCPLPLPSPLPLGGGGGEGTGSLAKQQGTFRLDAKASIHFSSPSSVPCKVHCPAPPICNTLLGLTFHCRGSADAHSPHLPEIHKCFPSSPPSPLWFEAKWGSDWIGPAKWEEVGEGDEIIPSAFEETAPPPAGRPSALGEGGWSASPSKDPGALAEAAGGRADACR